MPKNNENEFFTSKYVINRQQQYIPYCRPEPAPVMFQSFKTLSKVILRNFAFNLAIKKKSVSKRSCRLWQDELERN